MDAPVMSPLTTTPVTTNGNATSAFDAAAVDAGGGLTGKWGRTNEAKVDSFFDRARHGIHCSLFCGGVACKHEDWNLYKERKNVHPAIEGLNSNWVGDAVVASQRPSTSLFLKYLLVQQFKSRSITGVFNLQEKGEHASCGPDGIYESSGYSYNGEQDLMRHGIHYYEFPWPDMTAPDNDIVLRSVQVMESHVKNSGKVLVHCHAGLGRTGLLIACHMIFSQRMSSADAIRTVRLSRPGAVQTSAQVAFVRGFEAHLWELQLAFRLELTDPRVELDLFMRRQRTILHGDEGDQYRYVPKPLHYVLCRAISLATEQVRQKSSVDAAVAALEAVAVTAAPNKEVVRSACVRLNRGEWRPAGETDAGLMMFLALDWFRSMSAPAVPASVVKEMVDFMKANDEEERATTIKAFVCNNFNRVGRHTIGMLLSAAFVITEIAEAREELRRFVYKSIAQALTHTHTPTKAFLSGFESEMLSDFLREWAYGIRGLYFDNSVVPASSPTIGKIALASQRAIDAGVGRGAEDGARAQSTEAHDMSVQDEC